MRLICKHFGFHGDYIQNEMAVGDFFCYLAESLDGEELSDYRDALLYGGKEARKKWKWATPDHAGTRPMARAPGDVRQQIMGFAQVLAGGGPLKKIGSINEVARLMGHRKVWKAEDGTVFDENGLPVDVPKGMVFIPLPDGERTN